MYQEKAEEAAYGERRCTLSLSSSPQPRLNEPDQSSRSGGKDTAEGSTPPASIFPFIDFMPATIREPSGHSQHLMTFQSQSRRD